jgi:hypothetical protein
MYKRTLWSIVLLDKLIVSRLVIKKLLAYGIRNFDTFPDPDEPILPHIILFLEDPL